jgi:choice-of-anchor C domain-containing protein
VHKQYCQIYLLMISSWRGTDLKIRHLIAIAFCSVILKSNAMAAPFTNGSFEIGTNPGGSFLILPAGSTAISGWTITSTIDYIGGTWQAADGSRSIDVSSSIAGSLQQSFDTVPGVLYEVRYSLAGNPGGLPAVKQLLVEAGSASQVETFDTTGRTFTNMGWTDRTLFFTASSSSSTLKFTSQINTAFGPALDNVRITAVAPEPGTLPLTLIGLGLALALTPTKVRRSS